jgi:hypothetical protein
MTIGRVDQLARRHPSEQFDRIAARLHLTPRSEHSREMAATWNGSNRDLADERARAA